MGSNSASTGGGGGVGPAGIKTDGTYGTKKDAKKTSRRNEFRTFVKEGGVVGAIIKGVTGKTVYERNLERRQKFVKSKGLTGEEINLDPSYLGSKEGLAELRKQGYTTASDTMNTGNDNGGGNQVVQAPTDVTMAAPTTAEVSQSSATDATDAATVDTDDPTYIKRKNKRQGRSLTILTSSKGVSDGLTLGKRSLLGS